MRCPRCFDRREVLDHQYDARDRITKPCPVCTKPETAYAQAMWRIGWALALLLAGACSRPIPPGAYQPVSLPAAVERASEWWGISPPWQVYMVTPDCIPNGRTTLEGFWIDNRCVLGFQDDEEGLFISDRGQDKYSATSLNHELAHIRWKDDHHTNVDVWGVPPLWPSGGHVRGGNAFLAKAPDVDVIR